MITNTPVQTYFDPEKLVLPTVDSSSTGLRAALIQNGKQNASRFRAFTTMQQKYSQLKKVDKGDPGYILRLSEISPVFLRKKSSG